MRLRALGVAVVSAAVFLIAARQLGCRGAYSGSAVYRAQVDAFLDGRLALSTSPDALAHDLAWTESGVQQVWGLGVPLWQTPFELAARAFGQGPFPDKVALLVWLGTDGPGPLSLDRLLARASRERAEQPRVTAPAAHRALV